MLLVTVSEIRILKAEKYLAPIILAFFIPIVGVMWHMGLLLLYSCKQSLGSILKHSVHLSLSLDMILSMCHALRDGEPVSQTIFIGDLALN